MTAASSPPRRRALVYGDVDLNILDGSAIWLQSTALVAADAGCDVTVVLKAAERTDRLTGPLREHPHVTLVSPHDNEALADVLHGPRLTPDGFVEVAARLERAEPFDLVVVRGAALAATAAEAPALQGRLWTYLTDIPQASHLLTRDDRRGLEAVAAASRFLLCQTEDLRTLLEAEVDGANGGRSVPFPPVVPEVDTTDVERPAIGDGQPLELVYLGKFARRWNTLELCELPGLLEARGIAARLHVIGDKFHAGDEVVPDFPERMRAALELPGVVWHGGTSRAEAMRLAAPRHVGMSWRDPELDASLELSTKVLEYGALGLPVVLNRTPAHEALLGVDYPGFAASQQDVVDVLATFATDTEVAELAAARVARAAADHRAARAVERFASLVDRAFPRSSVLGTGTRPTRVVVASHDLKFFTAIQAHLAGLDHVELRVDAWPSLRRHDPEVSRELLAWADVVVCEWAGPNAAWYAAHKRAGQRLVVRLHRVELYSGLTDAIDVDQVDQVVCVSPHYARLTHQLAGWPTERIVVVPNSVDCDAFDRPKLDGAVFHLGVIGASPRRKRLDLALDVLDRLRSLDPRFRLFVRSRMPWEQPWVWRDDDERRYFDALFERIRSTSSLRDGVVFDGFGPDVPAWLRRIGHVLSTSDDESFHLSPAEGMASRGQPLVRPWPGSETIYDDRWRVDGAAAMARRILALADDPAAAADLGDEAHRTVREAFGLEVVLDAWERVVAGEPVASRDTGCLMGDAAASA
jgi:glycosyltransferase involved in cell wall biosynthesis